MFDRIRNVMICRTFEEEDRARIADLLNVLLLTMMVILVAIIIFQLVVYRAPTEFGQWFTLLGNGSLALLIIVLLLFLRRGYVMRVGGVLSFALWMFTTSWIYSSGHLYDLSVTIYFLVVAVAGLTLGGNAALISGFMSVVVIIGAYYLQSWGIIPPPDLMPHPFNLMVTVSVLSVVTLLLRFAMHSMSRALAQARRDERALLERNRELQAIRDVLESRTAELQDSNQALQQEVVARMQVEQALHDYQENLEDLVEEKTYELRLAIEQAEQARILAEMANQAKSRFMAKVSHEFRTPLTAILGFSQLLLQASNMTAEQRENLEIVCLNGENLLALINDVLALSRLSSVSGFRRVSDLDVDHVGLDKKNFDLYHVLNELEDMFRLQVERKGLGWMFERSPDLPRYIATDEAKLRSVLINLLDNAVKFTERGHVRLRVLKEKPHEILEAKASSQSVRPFPITLVFEVEDTGPGIASEELRYLFEPFSQTSSARRAQEGRGLGLPISREFVQCMGGDIVVESKVGQGTRLRFDIRAWDVDKVEGKTQQPTERELTPDQKLLEASEGITATFQEAHMSPAFCAEMVSGSSDLPAPWVRDMLRALTSADFGRILDLAERIRERDVSLAEEIRTLAYRFDYAAIKALIEL